MKFQIVKLGRARFGWVVYSEDELTRSGQTFGSDPEARVDLKRHYRVRV